MNAENVKEGKTVIYKNQFLQIVKVVRLKDQANYPQSVLLNDGTKLQCCEYGQLIEVVK